MKFEQWYEKNKEVLTQLSSVEGLSRAFGAGTEYEEEEYERN